MKTLEELCGDKWECTNDDRFNCKYCRKAGVTCDGAPPTEMRVRVREECPPQVKQVFELLPEAVCLAMDKDGSWYCFDEEAYIDFDANRWIGGDEAWACEVTLGDYKVDNWMESLILKKKKPTPKKGDTCWFWTWNKGRGVLGTLAVGGGDIYPYETKTGECWKNRELWTPELMKELGFSFHEEEQ